MKHNFNYPQEDVIPHFNGMPCECVDCGKNASYTKQLNDRNAVYVNAFDFPDFGRLQITARDLVSHADAPTQTGEWVYSSKDQPIYRKAGDKVLTIRKAGKPLGHFKSLNTKGNWMIVTDVVYGDVWVSYTRPGDFYYKHADPSKSQISTSDKLKIAADVGSMASPAASTGAVIVDQGSKAAVAAGDSLLSLIGPLKWILIGIVAVILLGIFLRLKG